MKLFEKILREHSYDGMTVKEFYDKFSSLDLEDKDYGARTDWHDDKVNGYQS